MRIAYDASSVAPRPSGVGQYAASLLDALSTQFPDRQFLVLSHRHPTGLSGINLTSTQRRSFPIKEIWMQMWLPHILARHNPDLCHFTNSVAPLRIKRPYVVTVHDLSLIRHPEWHPRTRRIWMGNILRPSVMRASGVLCDSEATRKDLLDWVHFDETKAWVVPLAARKCFAGARSDRERAAIRKRYGLQRPFLLYVGNVEPRKNLARLLEAYRRLDAPAFDLVLAGRRAWFWRAALGKIPLQEGRGEVHILDYVCDEDLPALYQSAAAFVYPSLMEGFGLPVLEAMVSGTPVLASKVEPLVSLVGDAGWLVRPDDTDAWESALAEVMRHPEMGTAFAARGKERAGEYSWDRVARETMRCYEAALCRRSDFR